MYFILFIFATNFCVGQCLGNKGKIAFFSYFGIYTKPQPTTWDFGLKLTKNTKSFQNKYLYVHKNIIQDSETCKNHKLSF